MSTNVEALTPRNPDWLRHVHLDRIMDPLSYPVRSMLYHGAAYQVLPRVI
ncbi:hypothetical protein HDF08_003722 [Edaphobacter lichenicola]|uniref:Uncharacterized protein n=1 Tax=Tunturiibacter lichenicola TaxID=2051959 RepID=A0A852VFK5_9BACT|nr:hypothetical protein [Edaphobacter lichenicola]